MTHETSNSDIVNPNMYQTALAIQNASNLSGVAHTFTRDVLPELWQEARDHGQGTAYVTHHDVTILFLDKLADLAGMALGDYDRVDKAYRRVKAEAEARKREMAI
jgi:hypothetical protein